MPEDGRTSSPGVGPCSVRATLSDTAFMDDEYREEHPDKGNLPGPVALPGAWDRQARQEFKHRGARAHVEHEGDCASGEDQDYASVAIPRPLCLIIGAFQCAQSMIPSFAFRGMK